MAESILKINVEDDHFKEFQRNFDRFQRDLNTTPVTWKKTSLEMFTISETMKTIVSTLQSHTNLLQSIAIGTNSAASAAHQLAVNWQQVAQASQQVNQNVNGGGGGGRGGGGGSPNQRTPPGFWSGFGTGAAKELGLSRALNLGGAAGVGLLVGQGLVSAIQSIVSTNLSFLGGLSGLGGNLFGLDRLASAATAGSRSSRGLGVGYGEFRAAPTVFGPQFDANRLMEGISTGRGDITSDQYRALAVLGIDQRASAGDQMLQVRSRFREFTQNTPEHLLGPLMAAYGYDKFFSIQDARRAKTQPLNEFNEDTQTFVSQARLAETGRENQRLWTKFNIALGGASNTIESALIKGLAPLTPELTKISEALSEAISSLLGSQGFKDVIDIVARGLRSFADYVKTDEFRNDIVAFGNALKGFADTIRGIIDWWNGTNSISSKSVTVAGGNVYDAAGLVVGHVNAQGQLIDPISGGFVNAPNVDRNTGKLIPNAGNPNGGTGRPGAGTAMSPTQTTVAAVSDPKFAQMIQNLMGKGWTYDQAVGIVANIHEESGGDPTRWGDSGKSYGIAQWDASRRAKFRELYGKSMEGSSWQEQMAFVDWELRNSHQVLGAPGDMMTAKESHKRFIKGFEKPEEAHMNARLAGNTVEMMTQAHDRGAMMNGVKIVVQNNNPASINVQTQSIWNAQ